MTKTKFVIDTNIYLSALGQPDIFSTQSQSFFNQLNPTSHIIIMPAIIVIETLVNLKKQLHPKTSTIINQLLTISPLNLDIKFIRNLMKIPSNPKLPLFKTSDYIIVMSAKLNQATLITWDQQLLKSAPAFCPTLTPTQFLHRKPSL